jgi:hypothetical protein
MISRVFLPGMPLPSGLLWALGRGFKEGITGMDFPGRWEGTTLACFGRTEEEEERKDDEGEEQEEEDDDERFLVLVKAGVEPGVSKTGGADGTGRRILV